MSARSVRRFVPRLVMPQNVIDDVRFGGQWEQMLTVAQLPHTEMLPGRKAMPPSRADRALRWTHRRPARIPFEEC